jgi:hypothetical protein
VDTVGANREGYVGAGVDQKPGGSRLVVRGERVFANDRDGLAGEDLQFAAGEIFLAKLDVVHSGVRSFSDFRD